MENKKRRKDNGPDQIGVQGDKTELHMGSDNEEVIGMDHDIENNPNTMSTLSWN